MTDIKVKFGTGTPIGFREYDENYPQIDLDLEFRAAGISVVSAYDGVLYGGDEEAVIKTGEVALSALKDCVRTWPEGKSFWNSATKAVLEEYIDERLSEYSITAETDLFSLALTSESRELYDAAIKNLTEQEWFIDVIDRYKNVIAGNEGQPVTGGSDLDRPPMGRNPFTPSGNDEGFGMDKKTVAWFIPNGSMINTSGDKYCRQCGTKRENGVKFCTECGAKFG